MRQMWNGVCVALCSTLLAAEPSVTQDFTKGDVLKVSRAEEMPAQVKQSSGQWKQDRVYSDKAFSVGLQIETGNEVEMKTRILPGSSIATTLVGAHGAGTVVRFRGRWQGDSIGGYPNLGLTRGARFVVEKEAQFDLVMAGSFYTRQLWAYGDGSATLEFAEGFIADRTQGGTVPDAMGTVRLNGVHFLTHHSQSLPFNSRPDGRGGFYPNGHIVWEGKADSVWTVATHPQEYTAQLDFRVDGIIDVEKALRHSGRITSTSPAMNGGLFTSTGAFRTIGENIRILKRGPGMLLLQGQQGYYPGARLVVEEGLLRMSTNPGDGWRYDANCGAHLLVEVGEKGRFHLDADVAELRGVQVAAGAAFFVSSGTKVTAPDGIRIAAGGRVELQGLELEGDFHSLSPVMLHPAEPLKVSGHLSLSAPLKLMYSRKVLPRKGDLPESLLLAEAGTLELSAELEGQELQIGKVKGRIEQKGNQLFLVNLERISKKKK